MVLFLCVFRCFLTAVSEDEMLLALPALPLQTAQRHPLRQLPRGRYAGCARGRGQSPAEPGVRGSGRCWLFVAGGGWEGREGGPGGAWRFSIK